MIGTRVMDDERLWFALRLAAGGFLVPHGVQKLLDIPRGPGAAALAAMFEQRAGLVPGQPFVIVAGLAEAVAGALLMVGLATRLAALVAAGVLLAAIVLVNAAAGFFWTGGGIEYPAMWALLCLCFAARPPGPYSLEGRPTRNRTAGTTV